MALPDRVFRTISAVVDPKLFQRLAVTRVLQIVEYASSNDSVYQAKNICRRELAVGHKMQMVEHDDVGEYEESMLISRFRDRFAD